MALGLTLTGHSKICCPLSDSLLPRRGWLRGGHPRRGRPGGGRSPWWRGLRNWGWPYAQRWSAGTMLLAWMVACGAAGCATAAVLCAAVFKTMSAAAETGGQCVCGRGVGVGVGVGYGRIQPGAPVPAGLRVALPTAVVSGVRAGNGHDVEAAGWGVAGVSRMVLLRKGIYPRSGRCTAHIQPYTPESGGHRGWY